MNKPLVLWGGVDINPTLYNQEPLLYTQTPNNYKDNLEIETIKEAWLEQKPIVGICRGAQLLCVMNGGLLWQHSEPENQQHSLETFDKNIFNKVIAGHHQIMRPRGKHSVLAWNPTPVKVFLTDKTFKLEEYTAEVVWWPKTKSLAIQPHPEWANKEDPFVKWINETMKNLNIEYSF